MHMMIETPIISILQGKEKRNYEKYFSKFNENDIEKCIIYRCHGIPHDHDIRDLFSDDNVAYFYEFFNKYINGRLIVLDSAKEKKA